MNEAISRAKEYSEKKLQEIRSKLVAIVPNDEIIPTCGSFARREASGESDVDYFIISQHQPSSENSPKPDWHESVKSVIGNVTGRLPTEDGSFMKVVAQDEMLRNIGGDGDTNQNISRRILFLLEGEWLFNSDGVKKVRRAILDRYIAGGMTDHQLALFLLNDIIRFYRTMAVDYEFKTVESETPKPWGIRNIKLVFSRKLLYASGLFSVALTADRAREQKIVLLEQLFDMPVIDRMVEICGQTKIEGVLQSYNFFLEKLEKSEIRACLNSPERAMREKPIFRELKNEGHHFTRQLLKLFEQTFDSTHPIRRAVVF